MSVRNKVGQRENRERISALRAVIYSISIAVTVFLSAILQSTCLTFFGKVPALTLAVTCAVGFIFGERWGAVTGVGAGVLTDLLGSVGSSFSPIVFMLCGYCCGAFVGWFLSKNLPSFMIYAAIAGVFREIFTFVYFGSFSATFSLGNIFTSVVIPEYFAYLVCVLPSYGVILGIYCLFKGKDLKEKRTRRR